MRPGDFSIIRQALAGDIAALAALDRIRADREWVGTVSFWATHCSEHTHAGRCGARIDSTRCAEGHEVVVVRAAAS